MTAKRDIDDSRLEPLKLEHQDYHAVTAGFLYSIAISTKRIADTLDKLMALVQEERNDTAH